ncbi:KIF-binding protein [Dunckerocampus dactyliophorus]|uniref:KIF-binding protein n=1 Tax=Dunckerocampus dactyliophorus TaxID=161453 RepID=UPI0024057BBD|nr:KIF-binding protein [Dunckerocampus dactyliophorus]XP_054627263.1 KIF-binding protein [Dunckerocampus dactyliophorus]
MASLGSEEWKAICDKFTNAQNLTDIESRNDPENDPFRSKYKARDILREIHCSLKSFEAGEGEEDGGVEGGDQRPTEQPVDGLLEGLFERGFSGDSPVGQRTTRLAAVEYYLGVNHVDTEELSAGQEHLMNCMKLLERCRVATESVSLFIHVRNQLGILWAGRDETEMAQGFLETAESIYLRYMKEDGSPPTDLVEYFTTNEKMVTHQERSKKFELAYTHTMYYLAQVYKNLGQTERAATYCHSTLQRQLQLNQFSPMEWALNAATLSQYYITKGRYMEGRHCLSAATVISALAGEAPSEAAAQESEIESERRDQLRQKRAEIARCWIKYCLNLLQDAKKVLQDNIGELDTDLQEDLKRKRRLEEEEEEKVRKSALRFGSEDTFDSIASLEEKVSCLLPLDFTEARNIFLVGQNYVTQAKEYFQMDGYVTDHIEILQDHSALFRALAFFEEDVERRCKMHKRRVDMLETICIELNAQYYLMVRRQLMFELAETYNEMMDLKLTLANRQADTQSLDNHTIKKFNHLCSASAKYYQMFLDSLCSPEGKFPEHLEEEVLRPTLVARFRLARLHSRLICSIPLTQLDNLSKSLENYKYVVQYCEAHPDAAATVETELELSKEMAGLLPLKINRLKARMAANN